MSTNELLSGLGLVLVVAVSSQVAARRLGLPAIVLLLPAGFLAGVATDRVHPDVLLGPLYQPFVSLAVGVILFEAGLRLSFAEVAPGTHRVVAGLIAVGGLVTWLGIAATAIVLFDDLDRGVALLIGAILVVSGPTVVLPLLAFIRPPQGVRSALKWEGVLIDPLGALVGVLVFVGVSSSSSGGARWQPGELLLSLGTGLLIGIAGAGLLWLLLRDIQANTPGLVVPVMLMVVVAAVVVADLVRDDSGLAAATLMGIALANQQRLDATWRIDLSLSREFWDILVQLLIGVLFVLVAASVSPEDIRGVMPQALVLVAVMVLVIRPLAVMLATFRSTFTWRERAFVACLAPRGIVAGATAAAFGPPLVQMGVPGADRVLPTVFVAIFGTVVLYGLAARPVARLLGLAGTGRGLVLVVGGHPAARELAGALGRSGVAVRMWVGSDDDREAARAAGIDADRGRMMVDAVDREAELEEVTDVVLLTPSDDFNALAAARLRGELGHGHVYRVAPDPETPDLISPSIEGRILGSGMLTSAELGRRLTAGARFAGRVEGPTPPPRSTDDEIRLFAISADGRLSIAHDGRPLDAHAGDTVIVLEHQPGADLLTPRR